MFEGKLRGIGNGNGAVNMCLLVGCDSLGAGARIQEKEAWDCVGWPAPVSNREFLITRWCFDCWTMGDALAE
jgi:hypothetical protein